MVSGKKIMYITLLLAIVGVLIYCFFKKKQDKEASTEKINEGKHSGGSVGQTTDPNENSPILPISSYVGPQDCAENCDIPYNNKVLSCYNKFQMPGFELDICLSNAEIERQDCVGKCSNTLPRYKNLDQNIATPIQEANYFSNLFKQGYV